MLDFKDPNVAGREVEYAEKERDKRIAIFESQQKSRYVSPFFDSYQGTETDVEGNYSPENHYFEVVALMLPRLAFSNPSVTCTSRRLGPQEEVAIAMKHGLNRWVVDSHLEKRTSQLAVDYLFNYAVAHVSMIENPTINPDQHESTPMWPEVNRVSQGDFFRDPLAQSPDTVRFCGHSYLIDKEDMVDIAKEENKEDKDAGWSISDIEAVPPGYGEEEDLEDAPDRGQLLIKEIWVRGYEDEKHPGPDEGFHGTTFYYAFPASMDTENNMPIPIRDPQPFYGPATGPYVVGGMYYVPDEAYHLSSMVANEGPTRDLNRHARAMSDSMARYKNLILADNTDPLFADKVQNADHDLVLAIDGMDKAKVINMPVGGISPEWVSYFGLSKDRLDRASGIHEAMRGAITGKGTATETALADQAADTRIAWVKHQFTTFVETILSTVGWYMYHNDDVKFPIGRDAADELGVEEGMVPMFEGGDTDRESGASYEDLELKIEVMSMEHTSEATLQRRALQLLEVLTMVAQVAPTAPYIPWKDILNQVGQGLNIPGLAENFDIELFQQMIGMQMAEQEASMEAQLGKHAEKEPERPLALPFLQGNSTGSMLGATTGAS